MINWNNYFDHIVIISASKNTDRRKYLNKEFERIGLSNYEYFLNVNDNFLFDNKYENNVNRKNCLHAHYFVIKRAYELGYDSIWIMEDDIRFLKDEENIKRVLSKFEQEKYKSNIYMFDWIFFRQHSPNDIDYFSAASYWIDRKGMQYFIYCMEHYPIINDTWFMTIMQFSDDVQFNYVYVSKSQEEQTLLVHIPKNTVLPTILNTSELRLCIEVDESETGDIVSKYYIPKCEQNEIDENLYQLYSEI